MKKENTTKSSSPGFIVYDVSKVIAGVLGYLWIRPRILYESEQAKKRIRGGALLISNHIGFLDPIYLQYAVWYRRHHFICLQEFFDGKCGWLFKHFLCIPIDRENFSMNSFHLIVEHLNNGDLVSMFPEGKINDGSGDMSVFKSGVILMALKSKCPIIPMYVKERKHWYERLTMIIGEPITIDMKNASFSSVDGSSAALKDKEEKLKKILEERL